MCRPHDFNQRNYYVSSTDSFLLADRPRILVGVSTLNCSEFVCVASRKSNEAFDVVFMTSSIDRRFIACQLANLEIVTKHLNPFPTKIRLCCAFYEV